MERIQLSQSEKNALRLLASVGYCPATYPFHRFAIGVEGLQGKGLARAVWASGHELFSAEITDKGETYLALNPGLCNPVDWGKVGAVAGAVVAILALFVACSLALNS